ncbi:MAG: HAD-IA family hydrolase [Gammaproteobacteria bacterium]|nr:HAD-IA family hydrolase [Gammaproteobacteria bacterium]
MQQSLGRAASAQAAHARRVLKATRLDSYFELLIGGDTLPVRKPDPAVMRHVLQHFGIAPERAAHLGDSAIDIATARNAGVAAWAVPYGYNGGTPVAESRPDRMFATLAQVAAHVLRRAERTS